MKLNKLHWMDALNEETQWTSEADSLVWLQKMTGRKLLLSAPEVSWFFDQLAFMREQITCLHFGEPLALSALQERLSGVSVAINESYENGSLPLLVARRASNSEGDVLKSVCETLLLQFAAFLSEAVEPQSGSKIVRCEGLFREVKKERQRLGALVSERESAWRAELSLLEEAESEVAEEIQRCEDLFVLSGKAKFCSDACRFSTFQITKQLKDPGYMKEKQRRYRNRKEKH
ncbi:MAG: hypothetical protein K2Y39_26370 [Candidatus Obscuribacterales bacterium]|nr:hypothetical protein [Candidatus Obscuribacterales bacterium]